ncbi:MAG: nucleotidyl transferase AbiEii/AbiGii toxin family protein [Pyrinomonadaceae bacterium]
MLDIYDEFRRLIEVFDEQKVDYALCGGMAMAVHKRPRMTIDIDILIPPEFLERVIPLASELGYNIRGKDLSFAYGAVEIRRVSKIDAASGDLLSLDFLLVTPQLQSVWASRVISEWEGGTFTVVSRAGLIAMKQLRMSGQDIDDIEALAEGGGDAEN